MGGGGWYFTEVLGRLLRRGTSRVGGGTIVVQRHFPERICYSSVTVAHYFLALLLGLRAHNLLVYPFPLIVPDVLVQPVAAGCYSTIVAVIMILTGCIVVINGDFVEWRVGQRYSTPASVGNGEVVERALNESSHHQPKLYHTFGLVPGLRCPNWQPQHQHHNSNSLHLCLL